MRVHAYVDGFNLYYGARQCCRRSTPGWRWLDVRSVLKSVIDTQGDWSGASLDRVVYCTARVDARINPSGHADQDVYLKALRATGSVDWIEYGNYITRTKAALLAVNDPKTKRPKVHTSKWPIMVQDQGGSPVREARFMASYLHMEEKGSDVNVAAHMLLDVLSGAADAVIVVSNDSDLAFPIRQVRERVPLGLVNPRGKLFAGDLTGQKTDGAGNHWWWKLNETTYRSHQLPDPAGGYTKPIYW